MRFGAWLLVTLALCPLANAASAGDDRPEGFADVSEYLPGLRVELRYFSSDNFVGERIDGYEANRALLSEAAAAALVPVQAELDRFGLALKIYDAYRPQRAVAHFVRWAADREDLRNKADYYPDVDKQTLFEEGYIAARSSHSRGSTVDITLVDADTGKELDMGTRFDFFGPQSWPDYRDLSATQRANRLLLRRLMVRQGFEPYPREWWHFTLRDEPWPDSYFDFPIR